MADFKQYTEVVEKRASLLSNERFSHRIEDVRPSPPRDEYFLMRFLFFFIGIGGMVPMSFFLTATDYWMYKLRDVSSEDFDLNNKTYLQTNFASISSIMQAIPTAVTTILASIFAHKLSLRIRLLWTMSALTLAFVVFTIFVVINTDSWQFEFFCLTMAVSVVNSVFGVIFQVSNFALLARFPPEYIKIHTYGSSMSGIISALLQIFCLTVGGSSTQVALIYYCCATGILFITTGLIYISGYLPLYKYYLTDMEEDKKRPMPSFADLKEVLKRVWMLIFPAFCSIPVMAWSSPTITVLIVSEDSVGAWGKKYFMPVTTFLLKDIASLLGRFLATPFLTRKNAKWFILLGILQAYGLNPLFLFCNAQPRSHLPVLFPHDWEYLILALLSGLSMGYLATVTFLSMASMAGDKAEQGFQLFQSTILIMASATSPLSQVWVNIL